jgi:hypothetical protein
MSTEIKVTSCPVCNSSNIRADYDFPDTMKCCKDCGADFYNDGEITLDPRLIP